MARQYNFLYNQLVENENDIVGHVAYSLYKSSKVDYITEFKKKNGREPKESDLEKFHDISCLDNTVKRYRMQAMSILQAFLDDTLSSTVKQIEENTIHSHEERLKEVIKDFKPKSFIYGAWQGVVGAFIFMLIMCALLFLLNFSSQEYTIRLGGSGSAKIEQSNY